MPVLCLGQSSRAIGLEIDKLNHILGGVCGPSSTYISDEIVAGKSNDSNVFRMQKCAHILTEQTHYCAVCSQNSELLQEVVLRRLLESKSSSSCANQICLISDNYTQFGAWSSSITMEYLQQETSYGKNNHAGMDLVNKSASSGGIISVLVKPPMGCSRGLENMYSLLSTQHSLETAHATLFRGMEICSNHTSGVPQYNSVHNIACDLYPFLCATDSITTAATGYNNSTANQKASANNSNSVYTLQSYVDNSLAPPDIQYHLWPLDVVRTNNKIIDARSSLSVLFKKLLKSSNAAGANKSTDYNPLRSVAANVHALHLAYMDMYSQNADIMNNLSSMGVTASNYALLTLPPITRTVPANVNTIINTLYPTNSCSRKKCMQFTNVLHTEHELNVAFTHATPGITWPYMHNTKNSLHTNNPPTLSANVSVNASITSNSSTVFGTLATPRSQHSQARSTTTTLQNSNKAVLPYNAVNMGSRSHYQKCDYIDETDNVSVFTISSAGGNAVRSAQHNNVNKNTGCMSRMSTCSAMSSTSVYSNNSISRAYHDSTLTSDAKNYDIGKPSFIKYCFKLIFNVNLQIHCVPFIVLMFFAFFQVVWCLTLPMV